jgi:hypothetical protein
VKDVTKKEDWMSTIRRAGAGFILLLILGWQSVASAMTIYINGRKKVGRKDG